MTNLTSDHQDLQKAHQALQADFKDIQEQHRMLQKELGKLIEQQKKPPSPENYPLKVQSLGLFSEPQTNQTVQDDNHLNQEKGSQAC